MEVIYRLECYDKQNDSLIKSIVLPECTDLIARDIFNIESNIPLDGLSVTDMSKKKLEDYFGIKINLKKGDWIFVEAIGNIEDIYKNSLQRKNILLTKNIHFCCKEMAFFLNENKVDIFFEPDERSYSIGVRWSNARQEIFYCPWCGKKL